MQFTNINWRTIAVLNIVSTFAQLGQFGVGFLVLPIWLAARGMGAIELGLFGASEWAGMLMGLLITPKLLLNFTSKRVVLFGLFVSSVGFILMPQLNWPLWILPAFLIGFGMGLRWIANETWLYRVAPSEIVGEIVGFHEALIALAMIIGPLLVVWLSSAGTLIVLLGAAFNAFAALLLLLVTSEKIQQESHTETKLAFFEVDKITMLGIALATTGGVIDGAFTALFPIFGIGRGFSEPQIGTLLAMIGFGGLLLQYPLGWFSDKFGLLKASLLTAIITMIVSLAIVLIEMSFDVINALSFIFGGFVAAFLTLGIIAAASTNNHHCMAQNMSKVSIAFTASSIIGALLAGFAAADLGSDSLFWLVAISSSILAMIFLYYLLKSRALTNGLSGA